MNLPIRELSQDERLAWLRLSRSENIGPVTFFQLLRHFGSAGEALLGAPELARRGGGRKQLRIFPIAEAEREIEACAAIGARLVCAGEPGYPLRLAAIADPPPVIALRGHGHLMAKPMIAVVGARNASTSGNRFARRIAADLGADGFVIASGLARGIDASAHEGGLAGGTVAVIAGGIDIVYPPRTRRSTIASPIKARSSPRCPSARRPRAVSFPGATALFPGYPWASW